jgi:AraC family transcriptional regulator
MREYPRGRFAGNSLRSRAVGGLVFTETVYGAGLKLARHSHERACFVLVLQGFFSESYERRTRTGVPSMLIFRPQGEPHADSFDRGAARCLNIELADDWLERARLHSAVVLKESGDYQGMDLHVLASRLFREFRETDEASGLAVEGLMLEIISAAERGARGRAAGGVPLWLARAREFIHAHYRDGLTIAFIADAVGVHPVHLAREFRKHFHDSPADYVMRRRIAAACRELSRPDASLAHVAAATGFYDQSHFSKTFKRVTGTTPAKYRSALQRTG